MTKKEKKYRAHAVALYSGGLDSTLAILLMLKQNIRVTALFFVHNFGYTPNPEDSSETNPYVVARKFGFDLEVIHLGQKFVDIVLEPQHGRGAHMNPCVDCKILMMREAAAYMEKTGADFVVTGEVLGQRPFSQLKNQMNLVLKKSGLKGKLLRPLCAHHFPPTEPELSGLVDREQLLDIQGRSRKRQMMLAEEYGLEDYPTPAGGCLLTDKGFSNRLKDLIEHTREFTPDDIDLLKVGRHFRIDKNTKIVVGRNEQENERLEKLAGPQHLLFDVIDIASPLAILDGPATEENLQTAALLTARYCSARNKSSVRVMATRDGEIFRELTVNPAVDFDHTLKAIT
jgi:tRNA-specific 2-thiouridylase